MCQTWPGATKSSQAEKLSFPALTQALRKAHFASSTMMLPKDEFRRDGFHLVLFLYRVEILSLCFDLLNQKFVCIDHLDQLTLCFDFLDQKIELDFGLPISYMFRMCFCYVLIISDQKQYTFRPCSSHVLSLCLTQTPVLTIIFWSRNDIWLDF